MGLSRGQRSWFISKDGWILLSWVRRRASWEPVRSFFLDFTLLPLPSLASLLGVVPASTDWETEAPGVKSVAHSHRAAKKQTLELGQISCQPALFPPSAQRFPACSLRPEGP